jgi:hypothetical protein
MRSVYKHQYSTVLSLSTSTIVILYLITIQNKKGRIRVYNTKKLCEVCTV